MANGKKQAEDTTEAAAPPAPAAPMSDGEKSDRLAAIQKQIDALVAEREKLKGG